MAPSQITSSAPAFAVADRFIVNTISSATGAQGPDVVIVRVTLPAVMSAAEGV